ncbi:MAG: hypothetical protein D6681_17760 [Calditrichaeota bacterium]|nr:MAG: hypothetical protein D6681_17760 [Calditrichota bacterium]
MVLLVWVSQLPGQVRRFSIGAWHIQSLNGAVSLGGDYRSRRITFRSQFTEQPQVFYFDSRIDLRSQSYIWHPNFMFIDLTAQLSPFNRRRDVFLTVPNRTESQVAENFRLQTTFFRQRPFSVNLFANWGRHFTSREFATDVEVFNRDYGITASLHNRLLPVNLSFSRNGWEQTELLTGRKFTSVRKALRSTTYKSFGKNDRHQLSYAYEDYTRDFTAATRVRNRISSINLQNFVPFDGGRRSSFNSIIWYTSQRGSQTFRRFQAIERLDIQLPHRLAFAGNYQFFRFRQSDFTSRQHNVMGRLEHQLYQSLRSRVFYEYTNLSQTTFDEKRHTVGIGLNYRKKIPTGRLTLSYEVRRRNEDRRGEPTLFRVVDEEHTLRAGELVLLGNPFIDPNSVVVTDLTQTIIYVAGVDYLLIPRGDFLEIRRIPGGRIPVGATVLVDYQTERPISYEFDVNNRTFATSVNLFQQLVELYFRYHSQDFDNIQGTTVRILKTIHQKVYGGRLAVAFVTGGVEVDRTDSNILPYRSTRYYLSLNPYFSGTLQMTLTTNWQQYDLISEREKQEFFYTTGNLRYRLTRTTRLNLVGQYRFQEGRGLDLNLTGLRAEIQTRYRMLYITGGVEYFHRNFTGEKTRFSNVFLRLQRQF